VLKNLLMLTLLDSGKQFYIHKDQRETQGCVSVKLFTHTRVTV